MLSNREIEIIHLLKEAYPKYVSSKELATKLNKSIRTIQQEIKNMKDFLFDNGASIKFIHQKGYQLIIFDETKFNQYTNQQTSKNEQCIESQTERRMFILKQLLYTNEYIKADDFSELLFSSKSTINHDLKKVKEILNHYHIGLAHKPYYGLKIEGSEADIRKCMMNEILPLHNFTSNHNDDLFNKVSDITSDCFVKKQYKIDDVSIMNLFMNIYLNVKRMISKNYIEHEFLDEQKFPLSHEVEMSYEIYDRLSKEFSFEFPECEVLYLAVYIKGKRNYNSKNIITEEVNEVISDMLFYIKEQFNVDLSYDVELRIALALHFLPLNIRMATNSQLNNPMLSDIKQNFTFAYELATLSGAFLQNKFGYILNENELSYLAIHYNLSLEKETFLAKAKRILILCSSRTSDSLLLKYTLKKWFNDLILEMDVLNLNEVVDEKIKKYDVVFTTIEKDERLPLQAIKINYFLDSNDFIRIKDALHFGNEVNQLIDFFEEKLFIRHMRGACKEEIIKKMCEVALEYKNIDSNLFDSVILREQYGFTSFGNLVAIPHPNSLISNETFVVTAILDEPIPWGTQKVQLVFMICIERNGEKDLRRLFGVISRLLPDIETIGNIIYERNYDYMIQQLQNKI